MIDYKTYLKQMPGVLKSSMGLIVILIFFTFILTILELKLFLLLIPNVIIDYCFLKRQLLAMDENGIYTKGLLKALIIGCLLLVVIRFIGAVLWVLVVVPPAEWSLLFSMVTIGVIYFTKILSLRVFYSIYVACITDADVSKLIFTGKFDIFTKFNIIALSEILIKTLLFLGLCILILTNSITAIIVSSIVVMLISKTTEFTAYYFLGKDAFANANRK